MLTGTGAIGDDEIAVATTTVRTGFPTPSGGTVDIEVADGSGTILDSRQISTTLRLAGGDELTDVFSFVVPFPEEALSVSVRETERGLEAEINPLTRSLRDLFDRIPDPGFVPNAAGARRALENNLDTVNRHTDNERYRPAANVLGGIRRRLGAVLIDGYETPLLQQLTRSDVLDAVDDRIRRIEAQIDRPGRSRGR